MGRYRVSVSPDLLEGAEPYHHDGGEIGVLLCHGFTGSPQSLRPWAERLAEAGHTVTLPLLPGHGRTWKHMRLTRWEDWYAELDKAFESLRERCGTVFVMGLSMGGTLALRIAEQHGTAVAGVVVVNPSLSSEDRRLTFVPVLRHLVASVPGIGSDIKSGGTEVAYDRVPLDALHSLRQLWAVTVADLPKVTQPVLLYRSSTDHVVPASSSTLLLSRVSSTDVEEHVLTDSFHVATLDNDAPTIFSGSLDFIRRLAPEEGR